MADPGYYTWHGHPDYEAGQLAGTGCASGDPEDEASVLLYDSSGDPLVVAYHRRQVGFSAD